MRTNYRRAGIEIEYRDGSMRIIARDNYVSSRLSATFDKLFNARSRIRKSIRAAWLYYTDENQGTILAQFNL